jgi:hypothetical protein
LLPLGGFGPLASVAVAGQVAGKLLDRDEMQVGQGTPAFVQAEPVAGEELVGDREADVVERHVVDEATVGAVEERDRRKARRIPQRERPCQEVQRQASVDDVLDDEHVPVDDRRVEVLEQLDPA